MNERMTQLHVEAARYAKEKYPNDIVEWSICTSEKFADLIVWDCMLICEDVMKKDNSALGCWSEIKRKFRS
jgi:hypothetical protein